MKVKSLPYSSTNNKIRNPDGLNTIPKSCYKILNNAYALAGSGTLNISAIDIDNQADSGLARDADTKQSVSPVIVWQDGRTRSSIEKLLSGGVQDTVPERRGPA